MKYFKFLLINIIAFSFLFFMISLLFPGQVITSKTVSVNSSKENVMEKLNNTSGWKNWNAFVRETEGIKNNTVTNSDTLHFSFENNHHELLKSRFIIFKDVNAVLVNWDLTEKLPWYKPWKKFSAMVLSKDFAIAMDSSLNNFKLQAEAAK